MKKITPRQIKAIQTAIRANGLQEQKEALVLQYTNNRETSVANMTFAEAQQLLQVLNAPKTTPDPRQKMYNQMIAAAHEMGWIKKQSIVQPGGSIKVINNYDDLHNWVLKYGYLKKPLSKYTYEELPKLVTAFRNLYQTWLHKHH
jgi:hypothetical protein